MSRTDEFSLTKSIRVNGTMLPNPFTMRDHFNAWLRRVSENQRIKVTLEKFGDEQYVQIIDTTPLR
jgi:hypothetical protein